MKKLMAVAALATLSLAGCATHSEPKQATSPICQNKMLAGGWQVAEMTPEVEKAVATLMDRMNTASPLKQVNEVRSQVVNGTNYAIEIELENGEVWHAIVYRNIRGDYMIDSVAKQGKLCP
ncbi:cystatin domain-containing protein [Vibrio scophthalmi]|uniref:cystatin domain-containing protein n=1 Tax=Vibrio scophthalmi TaxID=45658 RepID=UPI002284DEEA|nr:cystatin domain-containing protein [Vibrio scophthalmi]MCY9804615.1 cystatin domain-containing protein [Vibrio scophthalmi]